jgi:hypothetical protein
MSPTDENLSNLGTAISQGEEDLRIRVSEQNQIKCPNKNSTTFLGRRRCSSKQTQPLF